MDLEKKGLQDSSHQVSVNSNCCPDTMMLKQHSSSQLLPSRSRRLWRKLCLWCHRNLQKSWSMKVVLRCVNNNSNEKSGYSNYAQEPKRGAELEKVGFQRSFAREFENKSNSNHRNNDNHHHKSNVCYGGVSGLVPQSQSVARNISKDSDATSVTQYLNSSPKIAHITSMDIRIIPNTQFSNLRTLNLSSNSIAHITPGMLPKGLQYLDLSRNNIAAITGLRELTRLQVLSLGYNRIFRIGKGLSKCTLIKELNLAGNKISDLEGLHRLSKLTVLDLSFNKITTDKPLGRLVANYNSLRAFNLLGNPIESNIREEQLKKVVSGLLLHLVYFNKQPIKPQRAQEVVTSIFTKLPVLNNKLYHRRRVLKMAVDQGESSSSGHWSSRAVGGPKSGKRSKGRSHQSNIKERRSSSHAAAFH